MTVLDRVRLFARRHDLWRPGHRVIAAVSGGADSVALVLLLRDLAASGELTVDAVAHLNHAIRGSAADADAEFCRRLSARLGLPFVTATVDVPALAARERWSIEVAARRARHRFLDEARRARGADRVATAHTQDDQAETVLLRLVRGTGLRGLGGIRPRRDQVIRPLLICTRDELRVALTSRFEPWCEDASNTDLVNPRNRVRHEVLPYLGQHFNPSVSEALARLAEIAQADDAWMEAAARDSGPSVLRMQGDGLAIDQVVLHSLPEALARRVVRHALEVVNPVQSYGLAEVDLIRAAAAGAPLSSEIRGLRVERRGAAVVLLKKDLKRFAQPAAFCYELPIPGSIGLPEAGVRLEADGPHVLEHPVETTADQVTVEAAQLGDSLVVRSRCPGDQFRPLGLGGRKKLQDLFVDRKVRREDRDRIPVVTDHRGRIVWVAGHALAEDFRVTDRTNAVVVLKLRRM